MWQQAYNTIKKLICSKNITLKMIEFIKNYMHLLCFAQTWLIEVNQNF